MQSEQLALLSLSSRKCFTSFWVKLLSRGWIEESKMSEVLILQSPFDFQRKVVVHFEHHHTHLVVNVLGSEVISDDSPCKNWYFSHVPTSSFHEISIPNSHSEQRATESRGICVILQSFKLIEVRLELRVELSVGLLPLEVIQQHFLEQILVLSIVHNFSSGEISAESIFRKSSSS